MSIRGEMEYEEDYDYKGVVDENRQKRDIERRRLEAAYGRVFGSDEGHWVLEDLFFRYGFTAEGIERPSVLAGESHADAARRDGMKEVVRHILRMCGAWCQVPDCEPVPEPEPVPVPVPVPPFVPVGAVGPVGAVEEGQVMGSGSGSGSGEAAGEASREESVGESSGESEGAE
jgi:hypothetical protein